MLYSGLSFAAFTLTPLKPTKINEKPAIGLLTIQFFSDQNMQEETYSLGDCADCAREMQQNEVA